MKNKLRIVIILLIAIVLCIVAFILFSNKNMELKTIKSEKELLKIYNGNDSALNEIIARIFTMPFSFFENIYWGGYSSIGDIAMDDMAIESTDRSYTAATNSSVTKDYSTTNIQVENVDEADITKTDGNYIYSISNYDVIITNVMNPNEIKIETRLQLQDGSIPVDLILYNNKLVVISTKSVKSSSIYTRYYNNSNTLVKVYDVTDKSNIHIEKSYELYEPYYTSRCIDNNLYVIASGYLRKEDNKIVRTYKENGFEYEIDLNQIHYLKDLNTKKQTIISFVDLNNTNNSIRINSYLMDISNAYVSENSIYLLNQKYDYSSRSPQIKDMFGLKGFLGVFDWDNDSSFESKYETEIYKFNISRDGNVEYSTKNKVDGKTINQYSLDEFNNHLRIALYDSSKGSHVVILDEDLKEIGASGYVAKGETMYSSRFIGNKVYLVTYKTMDPLFVIDLSNETKPAVLGELHIPGYSTYLHPYDENHLIGIGMETEEVVNRNSFGVVTSTTSRIIGMKMALFDVSDVYNPIQISQTIIGDRRTTSAILTNPKALLFSKEKELIAIPVNNYSSDFEITSKNDTYTSAVNSFINYNQTYNAEGYFVYKINLEDGFNLKGIITHEVSSMVRYYNTPSKLLRGLYIDDNLYTVSESAVKVNNLDTLKLISELKIK